MKKQKIKGYENIFQVDCFEKEFSKTTSEKNSGRYHKWLIRQLAILDTDPEGALKLDQFEKLSNTTPDLYAIRYAHSKKNPRIIYVYVKRTEVCLLCSFKETKQCDYKNAIKTAESRARYLYANN